MTQQNNYSLDQWLEEGIIAAKSGNYEQARFRLLDVVEQDQTNETAWFWLYQVFHRLDDKRVCLENLLVINPQNQWAAHELRRYLSPEEMNGLQSRFPGLRPTRGPKQANQTNETNVTLPIDITNINILQLVMAFWAGISIIFLGGGIIATTEWVVTGVRDQSLPNFVTAIQIFELTVAISFVIVGIMGFNVAIGLYLRSMIGFYGSLLLAVSLLLIGPTISLIAAPPNYIGLVCTGGVSGMIILLTLASQPGYTA